MNDQYNVYYFISESPNGKYVMLSTDGKVDNALVLSKEEFIKNYYHTDGDCYAKKPLSS
jgi:hypothetical protein